MASDESSSSSSSSPSVDSYIGSVISLTSKSEIRYEGVLVSINPQESTIALQNVKSHGTEGRRKEGPQIPPSDKVYEYILFRGSDIKDLQVKSTPSIHPKQQTHNDPAIIQSCYAYSPATHNPAIPAASAGGVALSSFSSNAVPQDMTRQAFPDTSSLYQTGAHLNSWTPSPAIANVDGPMQSHGYIGTSSGQTRGHHQSGPFHPQSISLQNPLQYPEGFAPTSMAKFPENAPSLIFPFQSAISNPYNSSSLLSSNTLLASSLASHVPTMLSLSSSNHESNNVSLISNKASPQQSSFLPVSSMPFSSSSILGSASALTTTPPPLLTPNQLANSIPSANQSLHKLYPEPKDKRALLPSTTNASSTVSGMPQKPLLPLPVPSQQGERGVTQFTDEFDFTAMNEKFNKDEVWGSLGKEKQRVAVGDGTEDDATRYNVEVNDGYSLYITRTISSIRFLVTPLTEEDGVAELDCQSEGNLTQRLLANSNRGLLWVKVTMVLHILDIIGVHITEGGVMDTMVEEAVVVVEVAIDPVIEKFSFILVVPGTALEESLPCTCTGFGTLLCCHKSKTSMLPLYDRKT